VVALFAGLDSFEGEVAQVRRGLRGEIRIGVMDSTISDPLSPLVGALSALEGSDMHMRLSVLDPESIEQRVLDGRLDVGIVPLYRRLPGLEYRTIYREQMLLYCGRAHPFFDGAGDPGEAELRNSAFVEHGYVNGLSVDGFSTPAMTGATAWQVEAVAILIMTGRYLGYLPEHYGAPLVAKGSLRQLRCAQGGYQSDVAAVFKPITTRSNALTRLLKRLGGRDPVADSHTMLTNALHPASTVPEIAGSERNDRETALHFQSDERRDITLGI
jgi:DNA-binding transcriptional LysR family regulator